jgi:HK97 family phage prohead protease
MKREAHPRLYTADEFRAEAAKANGRVLPLRKEFAGCVVKSEAEGGPLNFVLSTATPDRSNDVVSQDGWRLENYRKNPVMLWAHDYSQRPVAKAPTIYVEDGKLVAKGVEFVPREVYEDGWSIGEMYRRGFLNAVSVGFAPLKYNWNEERGGSAMDFHEQELLEFSAVPVPANPEALVAAKAAGLPIKGIVEWAERILDATETDESPELVVPKGMAEAVWRAAKGKPSRVESPDFSGLAKSMRRLTKALDAHREAIEGMGATPAPAQPVIAPPPAAAPKAAPSPQDIADAIGAEVARRLAAITGRKP